MSLNKYDAISYIMNLSSCDSSTLLPAKIKFTIMNSQVIIEQINTIYTHYMNRYSSKIALENIAVLNIKLAEIDAKSATRSLTLDETITKQFIIDSILANQNQININTQIESILVTINNLNQNLYLLLIDYNQQYPSFNLLDVSCKSTSFDITQCYFDSITLKNQNRLSESLEKYTRFQNAVYYINGKALNEQANNENDPVKKQQLLDQSAEFYSKMTTQEVAELDSNCETLIYKYDLLKAISLQINNTLSTVKQYHNQLEELCKTTTA